MFYYLSGTVALMEEHLAVIDCGGVGYACKTTGGTLSRLRQGEKARLFTYLSVREDAVDLYGFGTKEELNCFRQLIGVSGVGPKAALAILSSTNPAGLAMAVVTGDEKALIAAPGIGRKTAQRIILELKDKMAKSQAVSSGEAYGGKGTTVIPQNKLSEATAALAVLGYSPAEISAAFQGIQMESLSLEEIIRQALKKMVK